MKNNVVLVNTSRGEVVHIPSLIQALESKKLWGAALDVFEVRVCAFGSREESEGAS